MGNWYDTIDNKVVDIVHSRRSDGSGIVELGVLETCSAYGLVGKQERFSLANRGYSYDHLLYMDNCLRVSVTTNKISEGNSVRVFFVENPGTGLVTRIPVSKVNKR